MSRNSTADLQQFTAALLSNWYLMLLPALLAGGIAFALAQIRTPIYRSETGLVLDRMQAPSLAVPDIMVFQPWDDTFVRTHTMILESEYLIDRAVHHLLGEPTSSAYKSPAEPVTEKPPKLLVDDADRDQLAAFLKGYSPVTLREMIESGLSVGFLPKSRILSIKLSSSSPEFAAAAANALAAAYSDYVLETFASTALQKFERLRQQSDDASRHLQETAQKLLTLKKEGEINVLTRSFSDDLGMAGSLATQIEQRLALRDPKLTELQNNLASTRMKIVELMERYQPKHPVLRQLEDEQARLEMQIAHLKDSILVDWQTKHLQEQTALANSMLEQEVDATRRVHEILLQKMKEIDLSQDTSEAVVRILKMAAVSRTPVYPRKLQDTVMGVLAGAVAGMLLALLRTYAQSQLVSLATTQEVLPVRFLGYVPHVADAKDMQEILRGNESGVASNCSESFKHLRTNLLAMMESMSNRAVLITSADRNDGKTTVVAALAHSFAHLRRRVLVLDLDLRKGRQHKVFGPGNVKGVTELLEGQDISPLEISPFLDIFPCGRTTRHAAELLSSPQLRNLINKSATQYDVILIDSCPLMPVTDAALVAPYAGVRIMVMRSQHTHIEACRVSASRLDQLGCPINGMLLNDVRTREFGYYGYYRHYRGYYSGYDDGTHGDVGIQNQTRDAKAINS